MLKVINLYVINRIFNEASILKLTASEKMLYINCLTYYFDEKKANVINNAPFEIKKSEIKKYEKFEKSFMNLHLAELVIIKKESIYFNNCWDNYIEKSLLEKVPVDSYIGNVNLEDIDTHIEEIKKSDMLIDLFKMKYKIQEDEIKKLIELFYIEQKAFSKKYSNFSDCMKHFTYWAASQVKNKPQKVENKLVKSQGKILGYE